VPFVALACSARIAEQSLASLATRACSAPCHIWAQAPGAFRVQASREREAQTSGARTTARGREGGRDGERVQGLGLQRKREEEGKRERAWPRWPPALALPPAVCGFRRQEIGSQRDRGREGEREQEKGCRERGREGERERGREEAGEREGGEAVRMQHLVQLHFSLALFSSDALSLSPHHSFCAPCHSRVGQAAYSKSRSHQMGGSK